MIREWSIRVPRRGRPVLLRTSLAGAVALLSLGLTGCGEPGGGGGGGGYLTPAADRARAGAWEPMTLQPR